MDGLSSAVVATLGYFDCFNYPLTGFEVWKWLWVEKGEAVNYADVQAVLEHHEQIESVGPFWVLKGRKGLVAIRAERERIAIVKLDKARRFASLLRLVPGIVGVAACNSLGYRNTRAESDLDFFIITEPGTIWFCRFVGAAMASVLGLRPKAGHHTDGVCLSFWISRDQLCLESLALLGGDPYLTYWTTQLIPLVTRGPIWQEFWAANQWIKKQLPNAKPFARGGAWFERYIERPHPFTPLARRLNELTRDWQQSRFPQTIKTLAASGGNAVVISEHMLKFHDNDQRSAYRDVWLSKWKN